jgi:hypothetical protein
MTESAGRASDDPASLAVDAPAYKPETSLAALSSFDPDFNAADFAYLANSLVLTGSDFAELCETNARIYQTADRADAVQLWTTLKTWMSDTTFPPVQDSGSVPEEQTEEGAAKRRLNEWLLAPTATVDAGSQPSSTPQRSLSIPRSKPRTYSSSANQSSDNQGLDAFSEEDSTSETDAPARKERGTLVDGTLSTIAISPSLVAASGDAMGMEEDDIALPAPRRSPRMRSRENSITSTSESDSEQDDDLRGRTTTPIASAPPTAGRSRRPSSSLSMDRRPPVSLDNFGSRRSSMNRTRPSMLSSSRRGSLAPSSSVDVPSASGVAPKLSARVLANRKASLAMLTEAASLVKAQIGSVLQEYADRVSPSYSPFQGTVLIEK